MAIWAFLSDPTSISGSFSCREMQELVNPLRASTFTVESLLIFAVAIKEQKKKNVKMTC